MGNIEFEYHGRAVLCMDDCSVLGEVWFTRKCSIYITGFVWVLEMLRLLRYI